jgi:hypothetical protein
MRFFVTSKAKVGSAFNANGFTLRVMMHYSADQKAAFADSMKELVEVDKFVEERDGEFRLTQAGVIHTTPEPPDLRGGRGGPRGPRR